MAESMKGLLAHLAGAAALALVPAVVSLAIMCGWAEGYRAGRAEGFRLGMEQAVRDINGRTRE